VDAQVSPYGTNVDSDHIARQGGIEHRFDLSASRLAPEPDIIMSGDCHRPRKAGELDGKPPGGVADSLDGHVPRRS
jgi:hypothetical protein